MSYGLSRLVIGFTLSLLLFSCGQPDQPVAVDPYANGQSYPWEQTSAVSLTSQSLTPGLNTLQFETPTFAHNSWGPVERNRSNGEQQAGDGKPLTLNGKVYAQGYGVHAGSELRFSLVGTVGASCSRFLVDVGIDDEVGNRGSVAFTVLADGQPLYSFGNLTGASATQSIDLNIAGKKELRLVVTDGGDGISYDHADWADPRLVCAAAGAPGTLDVSFGQQGQVTTDFGFTNSGFQASDQPQRATVDLQSRILVLGRIFYPREAELGSGLARYTSSGSLDPNFGQGGKVVFRDETPVQVKTDAQNRVLLLGPGAVLRRLTSSGQPDPSFGSGGRVTLPAPVLGTADLVVDAQGRITVLGGGGEELLLVRYTETGTLDSNFGSGGMARSRTSSSLNQLLLDSTGRLLVRSTVLATDRNQVQRFQANGSLDTSFGTNGSLDPQVVKGVLALKADGRIVVAGQGTLADSNTWVVRQYGLTGQVDPTFGQIGTFHLPRTDFIRDLLVDSQGRSVVLLAEKALFRVSTGGQADSGFGWNGYSAVAFREELNFLVAGANQKYIGVGNSASFYAHPAPDFALAQYYGQ